MPAGVGGAVPAIGVCWLATTPVNAHRYLLNFTQWLRQPIRRQSASRCKVAITRLVPFNKLIRSACNRCSALCRFA